MNRKLNFAKICEIEGVNLKVAQEQCGEQDRFRVRVTLEAGALEADRVFRALREAGVPLPEQEVFHGLVGFLIPECSKATCRRENCTKSCS